VVGGRESMGKNVRGEESCIGKKAWLLYWVREAYPTKAEFEGKGEEAGERSRKGQCRKKGLPNLIPRIKLLTAK